MRPFCLPASLFASLLKEKKVVNAGLMDSDISSFISSSLSFFSFTLPSLFHSPLSIVALPPFTNRTNADRLSFPFVASTFLLPPVSSRPFFHLLYLTWFSSPIYDPHHLKLLPCFAKDHSTERRRRERTNKRAQQASSLPPSPTFSSLAKEDQTLHSFGRTSSSTRSSSSPPKPRPTPSPCPTRPPYPSVPSRGVRERWTASRTPELPREPSP